MSKKNWNTSSNALNLLARILLTLIFAFGQTAWVGQNPKDKPSSNENSKAKPGASRDGGASAKAPVAEEETSAAEDSPAEQRNQHGGPHEGIKVHGHWTVEI